MPTIDRRAAAVALLAGLVVGCGGGDGKPPMARVVGTVTYKGKPIPKVAISFLPTTEGYRSGLGKTDEQGRFELSSYEPGDGVPVGPCKVAFALNGPPRKHPSSKMGASAAEEIMEQGDPLIPIRYFSPDKSGFSVTVEAGKVNEFTFDLKD